MTKQKIDGDYWLQRWYERRFLDRLWEIYPDGEWSWKDVTNYVRSDRFLNDLFNDLNIIAKNEIYLNQNDNHDQTKILP